MSDDEFIDLEKLQGGFCFDIRYATSDNFTGKVLYSSAKCFLRKKVALKLLSVQENLQQMGLTLKVYDAYRPLSVQKICWDLVPDQRYVADPSVGSKHNRGAAVDVTLVDRNARELAMPTPFDDFTEKAHRNFTDLPLAAMANRDLLEKVMKDQGFLPLPTEWWHFDDEEWEKYPVEDLSFEEIEGKCIV